MRGGGIFDLFSSDTQGPIDADTNNQVVKTQEQRNADTNNNPGVFDSVLGSVSNTFTDVKNKGNGLFDDVKKEGNGLFDQASTSTDAVSKFFTSNTDNQIQGNQRSDYIGGGRRRSRQMRMKGGRGLGLDYYATSVNGIKMAQPTYMEYYKGGRRRKTCKRQSRGRSCRRRRRR